MASWLSTAQQSLVVKNKVRKELWQMLTELIHWEPLEVDRRVDYHRLSHNTFVTLQTFLLIDGKGADTVSNDQLLNFCTTLSAIRSQLPTVRLLQYRTLTRPSDQLQPLAPTDVTISRPMSADNPPTTTAAINRVTRNIVSEESDSEDDEEKSAVEAGVGHVSEPAAK